MNGGNSDNSDVTVEYHVFRDSICACSGGGFSVSARGNSIARVKNYLIVDDYAGIGAGGMRVVIDDDAQGFVTHHTVARNSAPDETGLAGGMILSSAGVRDPITFTTHPGLMSYARAAHIH